MLKSGDGRSLSSEPGYPNRRNRCPGPYYIPGELQNPSLSSVSLLTPQKILKRLTQLSGYRVKDPMLSRSKTWEILIDAVGKDVGPKPKDIAETLLMKENLAHLPNLKIMGRRETPVDKEKEVGRWKVIEAELQERGLPVLGKATS